MDEKLTQIAENSVALYNRCNKYHYGTTVVGDGSTRLRLTLPFAPDIIQIICTDPRILFSSYGVFYFSADLNSLGRLAALSGTVNQGNLINSAMTSATVESRLTWDGAGNMDISNIKDGTVDCTFVEGLHYQVTAMKLSDAGLKDRFIQFVESLTGSGTAHICKAKVDAVFTAQEWAALKATKPDWTFQEV